MILGLPIEAKIRMFQLVATYNFLLFFIPRCFEKIDKKSKTPCYRIFMYLFLFYGSKNN